MPVSLLCGHPWGACGDFKTLVREAEIKTVSVGGSKIHLFVDFRRTRLIRRAFLFLPCRRRLHRYDIRLVQKRQRMWKGTRLPDKTFRFFCGTLRTKLSIVEVLQRLERTFPDQRWQVRGTA